MKASKIVSLISILSFLTPLLISSQTPTDEPEDLKTTISFSEYELDTAVSTFVITGTSSLHDWEMTSRAVDGAVALVRSNPESIELRSINVTVGVKTFESGNRVMNKKCYDALKVEDHPNIYYRFESLESITKAGKDTFNAYLVGRLTIAGVSKTIAVAVRIENGGDRLLISGTKDLLMSDFNVEPPKALLGTLKTGNEISIKFNLNYKTK